MPPVLEARALHKSFGAVIAAADVNVTVAAQEVLGIIGANGAGKTSFVNMVTGHLPPTSGTIRYLGRDITGMSSSEIARLGICRSFQVPQLFPSLPVVDNLLAAIGATETGLRELWRPFRRQANLDQARRLIDRFGLAESANAKAGQLPQGARKLLDIAMATVGTPKVLLLDEPTSGISMDEKFPFMDLLMRSLGEANVTVLFVEHDMEVVERHATRVIAFYEGRVIADGAPHQVLVDPDVRQYVVGTELHRQSVKGAA
jgi:branched-chain amino acid transport system ATP-binding protein